MAPTSRQQRGLVQQFMGITGASESTSSKCLKANDWSVEQAIGNYYQQKETTEDPFTTSQHGKLLGKFFDGYRDQPKEYPDRIGIEGAQRYLGDLGVGLEEAAHLALCELLQVNSIGEFGRDNFVAGWQKVVRTRNNPRYDNIASQSSHILFLRKKLQTDRDYHKKVYRHTYALAKPEGQRSVPLDAAVEFWRMFYGPGAGIGAWNTPEIPWLDYWLDYYESKNTRPVNKDLWMMVEEFARKTKENEGEPLVWFSLEDSWPTAIDEFVEFVKEKRPDLSQSEGIKTEGDMEMGDGEL